MKVLLAALPKAAALPKTKVPVFNVTTPVKVFAPESAHLPTPDFTMAKLPPPAPFPMIPVTTLAPVFVPFNVSVMVFEPVETPVTVPMLSRLRTPDPVEKPRALGANGTKISPVFDVGWPSRLPFCMKKAGGTPAPLWLNLVPFSPRG